MVNTEIKPKRSHAEKEQPSFHHTYIAVWPEMQLEIITNSFEKFISDLFEYAFDEADEPTHVICPEYGKLPFVAQWFHWCFAEGRITEQDLVKELKTMEV